MSLNTWGMPASLGSVYKEDRMIAIGEHISKAEFDVYLLEELWMRGDHATIKAHLPEGNDGYEAFSSVISLSLIRLLHDRGG